MRITACNSPTAFCTSGASVGAMRLGDEQGLPFSVGRKVTESICPAVEGDSTQLRRSAPTSIWVLRFWNMVRGRGNPPPATE